jgi:LPS sulfotransferase NodH
MNEAGGQTLGPADALPALSYFVCSTPRSGSTLLCERLTGTGVAGSPNEWMLPSTEGLARDMFGIAARFADPAYLGELLTKTRTANGVFGVKLMWPQMAQLLRGEFWNLRLGPPQAGMITLANLRYVRIVRRDRIRQAVSFLLAQRTNRWQRLATQDDPLVAAARRAGFETDDRVPPGWSLTDIRARVASAEHCPALQHEIDECLAEIDRQSAEWDCFFSAPGVVPLTVAYEDLVADSPAAMGRVLRYLGLEVPLQADFSRGLLRPMSDERNEALVAAYACSRGMR